MHHSTYTLVSFLLLLLVSIFSAIGQNVQSENSRQAVEDTIYARKLVNQAIEFHRHGKHDSACQYYTEALEVYNKYGIENTLIAKRLYKNLGQIYTMQGDFEKALEILNRAKIILVKNKNFEDAVSVFIEIGIVHQTIDNFNLSVWNYNEALKLITTDSFLKGIVLENLGTVYFETNEPDSAKLYFDRALQICNKINDRIGISSINKNYAKLYQQTGNPEKALYYSNKALSIGKEAYPPNHREIAKIYCQLASMYSENKDHHQSAAHYQEALKTLIPEFNPTELTENPNPETFYIEPWIMIALFGKGKGLINYYEDAGNRQNLEVALFCFEQASLQATYLRRNYRSEFSKQYLGEYSKRFFEKAIDVCFKLYEISPDENYISKAFIFSEKSKAMILLEALYESDSKIAAGVPDSIFHIELQMKAGIAELKNKLTNELIDSGQHEGRSTTLLRDSIFKLNLKLEAFLSNAGNLYPGYGQYLSAANIVELKDVQIYLSQTPNTAAIEYFTGENNLYRFNITSESASIFKIGANDNLHHQIQKLLNAIQDVKAYYNDPGKMNKSFTTSSSWLYQTLLKTGMPSIHNTGIERLVFIPDGQLNYLPFETLCNIEQESKVCDLSSQHNPYLVNDFAISYANSCSLLLKISSSKSKHEKLFAGYAPDFNPDIITAGRFCNGKDLFNLKYSEYEVNKISKYYKGDVYLKDNASKEIFVNSSPEYRILHLATHACTDPVNPMNTTIFFADNSLSIYELYNMRLNAELVVLSACNTGSGRLTKGEGVMSMARGFNWAGCKSSLFSLWAVDDQATSEIMIDFYENLNSGMLKSEALRYAKLNYLQAANKAGRHPFYWAAFVQTGDIKSISDGFTRGSFVFWVAIFIIVFGGILIVIRKQKKKSNIAGLL